MPAAGFPDRRRRVMVALMLNSSEARSPHFPGDLVSQRPQAFESEAGGSATFTWSR